MGWEEGISIWLRGRGDDMCEARLQQHTAYLEGLIAMVPPKYYLPPNPEEMAKKFQKHVRKGPAAAAAKAQHKAEATERRRIKLDPKQQRSVADHVAAERERELREDGEVAAAEAARQGAAGDDGDAEAPADFSRLARSAAPREQLSAHELRRRLAERLQQLRGSRGGTADRRADGKAAPKPPKHNPGKRPSAATEEPESISDEPAAGADSATPAAAAAGGGGRSGGSLQFSKVQAGGRANGKRKALAGDLMGSGGVKRPRAAGCGILAAGSGGSSSAAGGVSEESQMDVWQSALEKAGGIKQRDDQKLLKRMLKRKVLPALPSPPPLRSANRPPLSLPLTAARPDSARARSGPRRSRSGSGRRGSRRCATRCWSARPSAVRTSRRA